MASMNGFSVPSPMQAENWYEELLRGRSGCGVYYWLPFARRNTDFHCTGEEAPRALLGPVPPHCEVAKTAAG